VQKQLYRPNLSLTYLVLYVPWTTVIDACLNDFDRKIRTIVKLILFLIITKMYILAEKIYYFIIFYLVRVRFFGDSQEYTVEGTFLSTCMCILSQ